MEFRYYVKYSGGWFGISGTDDEPMATFLGTNRTDIPQQLIRKFNKLPKAEQTAVESAQAEEAAEQMLDG